MFDATEELGELSDLRREIERLTALVNAVQQANNDHCNEIERLRALICEMSAYYPKVLPDWLVLVNEQTAVKEEMVHSLPNEIERLQTENDLLKAALTAIIQDKATGEISEKSWGMAIDALRAANGEK